MKIATLNINNVNRRLPNLLCWLRGATALAPRLAKAGIDRNIRGEEGASDHAPVWIVVK